MKFYHFDKVKIKKTEVKKYLFYFLLYLITISFCNISIRQNKFQMFFLHIVVIVVIVELLF